MRETAAAIAIAHASIGNEYEWVDARGAAEFASNRMGTEVMALVLHALVRFERPDTVVEIGAGFTTLAILRALAVNHAGHASECRRAFDPDPDPIFDARYFKAKRRDRRPPRLHVVDNFSAESPDRQRLDAAIEQAGYGAHITVHAMDLQDFASNHKSILGKRGSIDLLWFDAKTEEYGTADMLRDYWNSISPTGAIVVHYTTGVLPGNNRFHTLTRDRVRDILEEEVEVMTFVEPHKTEQCSFTIIRRPIETRHGGSVLTGRDTLTGLPTTNG